jgi:hypothetical protein
LNISELQRVSLALEHARPRYRSTPCGPLGWQATVLVIGHLSAKKVLQKARLPGNTGEMSRFDN